MPLAKLNSALAKEIHQYQESGRAKQPERPICSYVPAQGAKGPRYKLTGVSGEFIRMNSNSYLDLSQHPKLIAAADKATHEVGVGPGAVRFIDGTFQQHIDLEKRIAQFVSKPAARILNSAYTSNLAVALAITTPETYWIGDELNHNSIIRAMRICSIPKENRAIFKHNDMTDLKRCLSEVPAGIKRVCVIFDGIFSMRGDCCPLAEIQALAQEFDSKFEEGVITLMDDSHGIGAFGKTGRGTAEHNNSAADIIIGTFGKAFGVNGGFVAGSENLVELMRHKSDTYIYTNPLSAADCAAAQAAIELVDSPEGVARLEQLHARIAQFRKGITELGFESIQGPHPVIPLLVKNTHKTHALVKALFESGILAVGLTFPVVPNGSELIRFQINAGHTEADIAEVLGVLAQNRQWVVTHAQEPVL